MNIQRPAPRKRSVNLTVNAELLSEAKAKGYNLSQLLEEALRQKRTDEWQAENAEAIMAAHERVEREGLWSSKKRVW
ncbi:MAG: type II toxin-antitoxin system CcdA family antitoxin [Proteobacteria bacterium]|nr:type II toxin-antitoxin system CcdA family antitoxin [Pseudomonadota bacterium]